jgi:hypothetical protein
MSWWRIPGDHPAGTISGVKAKPSLPTGGLLSVDKIQQALYERFVVSCCGSSSEYSRYKQMQVEEPQQQAPMSPGGLIPLA